MLGKLPTRKTEIGVFSLLYATHFLARWIRRADSEPSAPSRSSAAFDRLPHLLQRAYVWQAIVDCLVCPSRYRGWRLSRPMHSSHAPRLTTPLSQAMVRCNKCGSWRSQRCAARAALDLKGATNASACTAMRRAGGARSGDRCKPQALHLAHTRPLQNPLSRNPTPAIQRPKSPSTLRRSPSIFNRPRVSRTSLSGASSPTST